MTRFLVLTTAFAFATLPGLAADNDAEKEKGKRPAGGFLKGNADEFLKRFDKNNDGTLTKDELPEFLAGRFDRLDSNNDGKLDKGEVGKVVEMLGQRFRPPDAKGRPEVQNVLNRMLEGMDTNKDGKLSKEEARGRVGENFAQFDANKDGFLDREELTRALARMMAAGQGPPGAAGRRGPDFDSLDKDADGRLTRDELKGGPLADRFDDLDADGDGKITPREFESYVQKQAGTGVKDKRLEQ
jgi:Ca2+-binding EF-hand superfamily protein